MSGSSIRHHSYWFRTDYLLIGDEQEYRVIHRPNSSDRLEEIYSPLDYQEESASPAKPDESLQLLSIDLILGLPFAVAAPHSFCRKH